MHVGIEGPRRTRRRPGPYLGILAFCLLFAALAAAPAAAAGPDAPASQSVRLADRLRDNPVYVTDQLPRVVPPSTAPAFARLARRTGVPTYVLVLPDQMRSRSLLGTVHDRLGRNGLYVLLDTTGIADARAFGVRAPAEDASAVALYGLPYDAGPLRAFQEFVDTVAQGGERAAQRADALRKRYGGNSGKEIGASYTSTTDRANQSFLTGTVLLGAPLLVLLVSPYARRWRHRRRHGTGGARGPGRLPNRIELAVAAALAVTMGVGAPQLFDQTTDSAAPVPTHADMTMRLDRVTAGLRHDPLYTDPESPQVLDGRHIAELDQRIKAFAPGPVYIAVVPHLVEDESGGDADVFAAALHQRLGRDGVYVVADPLSGDIDPVDFGLRLDDDRLAFGLPDSVRHEDFDHPTDDHRLGQRLDALMTFLDGLPRTSTPGRSEADTTPEPLDNHRLPPLYTGDFWPGLLVGSLVAALLFGLTAGALGIVRLAGRRRRTPASPVRDAPTTPSVSYLRHTAQQELDALAARFGSQAPNAAVRAQVWDCLDAAMLLTDRDPDGRVDDDATPADLLAAIVLARAGQAALDGEPFTHCCTVNPLHGPASGRQDFRLGGERARRMRMCASCARVARREPHRIDGLRLTLPGRGKDTAKGGRTPYEEAAGALPSVRDGIPQLIVTAREYASVQ